MAEAFPLTDADLAARDARIRAQVAAEIEAYAREWDSAKNTGAYSKGLRAAANIARIGFPPKGRLAADTDQERTNG